MGLVPELAGMGGTLLLIDGLLVSVPSILLVAQEGLCAAVSLSIFFFYSPTSCFLLLKKIIIIIAIKCRQERTTDSF